MEKKKKELTEKELMEKYSDYLLTEGKQPLNVYKFMKELGYEEESFYAHFPGFDRLEEEYMLYFFEKSTDLIKKIDGYDSMPGKEKLLNFYYILIENLTMNRSLVLMILEENWRSKFRKLRGLRKLHEAFVQTLDLPKFKWPDKMPEELKKHQTHSKEWVLWMHFLSILKFWKEDRSAGFEKTDLFIEKTIDTGFELIDHSVMHKLFDLGKFLFHERF